VYRVMSAGHTGDGSIPKQLAGRSLSTTNTTPIPSAPGPAPRNGKNLAPLAAPKDSLGPPELLKTLFRYCRFAVRCGMRWRNVLVCVLWRMLHVSPWWGKLALSQVVLVSSSRVKSAVCLLQVAGINCEDCIGEHRRRVVLGSLRMSSRTGLGSLL